MNLTISKGLNYLNDTTRLQNFSQQEYLLSCKSTNSQCKESKKSSPTYLKVMLAGIIGQSVTSLINSFSWKSNELSFQLIVFSKHLLCLLTSFVSTKLTSILKWN